MVSIRFGTLAAFAQQDVARVDNVRFDEPQELPFARHRGPPPHEPEPLLSRQLRRLEARGPVNHQPGDGGDDDVPSPPLESDWDAPLSEWGRRRGNHPPPGGQATGGHGGGSRPGNAGGGERLRADGGGAASPVARGPTGRGRRVRVRGRRRAKVSLRPPLFTLRPGLRTSR